jgi:hypothetical protein
VAPILLRRDTAQSTTGTHPLVNLHRRPVWTLAVHFPFPWKGAALHRAGLQAMHEADLDTAARLFACAAERYRAELRVEPLARLRVHELIARVRAQGGADPDPESCIEVERMLSKLDRIEALEPPFELKPAHELIAHWLGEAATRAGAADSEPAPGRVA